MNLEKNARIYAGIPEDSPQDLKYCVMDKKAKYDAFIAGANWQEQRLVKVAVEIPIVMVDKTPAVAFSLPDTDLKKGDKIKVIVFKS